MRRNRWLALVGPLLVLAGCSRPKPDAAVVEEPKAARPPAAPVAAVAAAPEAKAAPADESPTRQECESLAAELEAAACAGKTDELRNLFDREAMLDRAVGDTGLSAAAREKLLADTRSMPDLASSITAAVGGGGSYRLVRLKKD